MTKWRDRLAALAEYGAWLASWSLRPGKPDCRVPPALLPERQTWRENAYLLWRSTVPTSPDVTSESKTARKPGVTHTVKLPRSCSAWSYSRQFETLYLAFGIL
jgi:hypothetical protein